MLLLLLAGASAASQPPRSASGNPHRTARRQMVFVRAGASGPVEMRAERFDDSWRRQSRHQRHAEAVEPGDAPPPSGAEPGTPAVRTSLERRTARRTMRGTIRPASAIGRSPRSTRSPPLA